MWHMMFPTCLKVGLNEMNQYMSDFFFFCTGGKVVCVNIGGCYCNLVNCHQAQAKTRLKRQSSVQGP